MTREEEDRLDDEAIAKATTAAVDMAEEVYRQAVSCNFPGDDPSPDGKPFIETVISDHAVFYVGPETTEEDIHQEWTIRTKEMSRSTYPKE